MKKAPARLRHYLQFKDFARADYEHLFARHALDQGSVQALPALLALEDRTLP